MTLKSISRRTAIGGTIASAAMGATRLAKAQQTGPVRVGAMFTTSGPLGQLGQTYLTGAQIAASQVNAAGGIGGRQIELVPRDSKFSPAEIITGMRELSGTGINLFLGDSYSQNVLAVLPLLKDLNVVDYTPFTIVMDATHDKYTPNFFRGGCNAHMMYGGSAALMAKQYPNAHRWTGIILDIVGTRGGWDAFANTLKRSYRELYGKDVEVLEPVKVAVSLQNFQDQIGQLISMNLDGLHCGLVGASAITFYKQAKPFGLFNKLQAVADTIVGMQTGPTLKDATPKNFWTFCEWTIETYGKYPMAQAFNRDFLTVSKRTVVDPPASEGHTGVMALAAAVKRANSTETSAVIAALESAPFDSVFGPIEFRKEDHQLLENPAYLHVEPQDTDPFYRNVGVVTIPYQEVIEPPSPGVPFVEH